MIQSLKNVLSLKNTRIIALMCFSRLPLSSSTIPKSTEPKSNSIADYLIKSCGFSPRRAAAISNYANRRPPPNPDSVRHFFKHHGFTDTQFRSAISNHYNILWADVDKTLEPNFKAVHSALSLSDSELTRVISSNPQVLTFHGSIHRIEFWKNFLKNDMKKLLSVFTKTRGLIALDIDTGIAPKIALLKSYGISEMDIGVLLARGSMFIGKSTTNMEMLLKEVQKLGFQCGSSMFVRGIAALACNSTTTFKRKIEFFKSYGWSDMQFIAALRKSPTIMELSCKNVQKKMEFLEGVVGCTQSYIALHPRLLSVSLEKRLRPRYHVLNILKSNKLVGKEWELSSVMILNERKFLERVIRYKEQEPGLHDTYVAACANQISL